MAHLKEARAPFTTDVPGGIDKLALFGWMKGTITVAPDVDLTEPTDPDWADLIDSERESSP